MSREDLPVSEALPAGFWAVLVELLAVPSTADRPEQLRRALDLVVEFVIAETAADAATAASGPATSASGLAGNVNGPTTGGSAGNVNGPTIGGSEGSAGGLRVERFESGGKPSALLYHAAGGRDRPDFRVILNAHLDVVPAPPAQFEPQRRGERLYARGTHDMKVSALVEALVFARLAATLAYPLALQLVTDEEVGGRDGTAYQLRHGVRGGFVVIGENSDLDIVADTKGLVHAQLRATGRAAHGAYPWLGDNALLKLLDSLHNLTTRYPVATEEAWRTTVNVARVETSNRAVNQIPADAEAWLDIRFPPEDTDLSGRGPEAVTKYLSTFCLPGVAVMIQHMDPAHHADHDLPEVRQLRAAARGQGYRGDFLRKHGAADGRFYSQAGVPAVIFGIGGAGQHGPEEYVTLPSVEPYYRALTAFLRDLDPRSSQILDDCPRSGG